MLTSSIIIWSAAAICFIAILLRPAGEMQLAMQHAKQNLVSVAPRLPFVILTAGFAGALLPQEFVSDWIGADSGWTGIAIASFMGVFVPGSPLISFPIALALSRAGAGVPQLVAFLTSWGVFEPQRLIIWEWPMLGFEFVRLRLSVSVLLPLIAGVTAAFLTQLWME
jgi:uncharacterized membrane protein YraQ (UPF0718 family)